MKCLLCGYSNLSCYSEKYLKCDQCHLVFKHPNDYLNLDEEKKRYANHQNSIEDTGYVKYLSEILKPLTNSINLGAKGLDFGCGPGPTLSRLISDLGYECDYYDPAFFNDTSKLAKKYDFITSTEVFEHMHTPGLEIERLWSMLETGGVLAIMTVFYPKEEDDFKLWWYKNDPTHVCFYNEEVFKFLAERLGGQVAFYSNKSLIIKKG